MFHMDRRSRNTLIIIINCQYLNSRRADLPTHPYLIVFIPKSAGSMDVCAYFSKYEKKFPESMEIATWTNASLLPGKSIVER